jgi:hypothetical protein
VRNGGEANDVAATTSHNQPAKALARNSSVSPAPRPRSCLARTLLLQRPLVASHCTPHHPRPTSPHLTTAYAPYVSILAATMSSERGARGGPTRARGRGTNPFRGTSRGGGSNGAPTQPAAQNTWTRGQRGGRGTAPRGTINSNVRGRGNKS